MEHVPKVLGRGFNPGPGRVSSEFFLVLYEPCVFSSILRLFNDAVRSHILSAHLLLFFCSGSLSLSATLKKKFSLLIKPPQGFIPTCFFPSIFVLNSQNKWQLMFKRFFFYIYNTSWRNIVLLESMYFAANVRYVYFSKCVFHSREAVKKLF